MANQNIFNQLLIFVNLYQHAKNEAVSQIGSEQIIDLKILQTDWLRAFWPIPQEQDFFPNIGFVQQIKNDIFLHTFPIQKIQPCYAQLDKSFQQENSRLDSRTESQTDPILQYASHYWRGSNNYKCCRLAFKSQRYRVGCHFNQNSQSACKKSLSACRKSAQFINSFLRYSRLQGLKNSIFKDLKGLHF